MLVNFKTTNTTVEYSKAIAIMERYVKNIVNNNAKNMLWFLEHKSVYTVGNSSNSADLIVNPYNIPVIPTQRGGQITFHGPGQRIVYLMIKLNNKDINLYINSLQNWIIDTLQFFNINAYTIPKSPGVWVWHNNNNNKIASLGIRIKKWVAYHGICINVNNNLEYFKYINPCGLNLPTTSLHNLQIKVSLQEVDNILQQKFLNHFSNII